MIHATRLYVELNASGTIEVQCTMYLFTNLHGRSFIQKPVLSSEGWFSETGEHLLQLTCGDNDMNLFISDGY